MLSLALPTSLVKYISKGLTTDSHLNPKMVADPDSNQIAAKPPATALAAASFWGIPRGGSVQLQLSTRNNSHIFMSAASRAMPILSCRDRIYEAKLVDIAKVFLLYIRLLQTVNTPGRRML
jgi:hypothetical protein